jgi:hypothetical protein
MPSENKKYRAPSRQVESCLLLTGLAKLRQCSPFISYRNTLGMTDAADSDIGMGYAR